MRKIRVLFVCYGNICRSPMAEFIFKKLLDEKGLADRFEVASAGTSGEHIGDSPDRRAAATLREHGISCEGKQSRRIIRADYVDYDYVIAMDRCNLDYMTRTGPSGHSCELRMLMSYVGGGDVDDPYYTGDFETTYRDISAGCEGLLEHIMTQHPELRS